MGGGWKKNFTDKLLNLPELVASDDHNASFCQQANLLKASAKTGGV